MNMGTPTVLPLKPEPVVSGSKDSNVVGFDKLHYSMIAEPVCDSWVLDDCLGTSSSGVRVIRADESCQLRPLEVCCTVCEDDGSQTQCIDHGAQPTALTLPVLPGDWKHSGALNWRRPPPASPTCPEARLGTTGHHLGVGVHRLGQSEDHDGASLYSERRNEIADVGPSSYCTRCFK